MEGASSPGGNLASRDSPVTAAIVIPGLRGEVVFGKTLAVQRPGLLQGNDTCLRVHLQPAGRGEEVRAGKWKGEKGKAKRENRERFRVRSGVGGRQRRGSEGSEE